MQSRAPALVLVSGAPGGGKTTLAQGWRPSYEEVRDFAALPEAALRW